MMAKIHLQLYVIKLDSLLDLLYFQHPNNMIKCYLHCLFIGKKQNTFWKYDKSRMKVQFWEWRIHLESKDVKVQNTVGLKPGWKKHLNFIGLFIVF